MLPTALPVVVSIGTVALASFVRIDTVELQFTPAEGATRTTTVNSLVTQQGSDLVVSMDGQEVPAEFLPDLNFDIKFEVKTVFSDQFTPAPQRARAPWRVRTIEEASQSFGMELDMGGYQGMEPISVESQATSKLAKSPFAIGVDSDGETAARWTEEQHPDNALLSGLRVDLDLAGLLPDKAIEVGGSWEAPAAALRDVLEPSGDLGWEWSAGGEDIGEWSAAEFEGTLELTLREVTKIDGVRVARIDIEGTLLEKNTRATDLEEVPVVDGTATEVTEMSYELEGELIWNLDANGLFSIEFEAEGEGSQDTIRDADQPGPSYESGITLEGTLKVSASCS